MAVVPKGQEGGHQNRSNVCASVVIGSGKSTELISPAGSLAWPSLGSTCGVCCLTRLALTGTQALHEQRLLQIHGLKCLGEFARSDLILWAAISILRAEFS